MSLTDSGCTMSLRPFGRTVTAGFTVDFGISRRLSAASAQPGSLTGFTWVGVKDSTLGPPVLPGTALPEDSGVRTETTACSMSRYFRAAAFTSSTDTFSMARTISSGDSFPSRASASDQVSASPGTEFFFSSAFVRLVFFAASTRSAGRPFFTLSASIFRISFTRASASPPFGKAARA